MRLKNVRLTLANVARTTNAKSMEVNSVGKVNKRDDAGNPTNVVDYVYADCAAYRGDTLRVKFPSSLEHKIDALKNKLEDDVEISISFEKLKLLAYALRANDGSVLSGVSAKAEDFTIVSTTADEIDPDDIIM